MGRWRNALRLILALAVVALTLGASAATASQGAVFAEGEVTVSHDLCDSIGKGDVFLRLASVSNEKPAALWRVAVSARSTAGCEANASGVCDGVGTLGDGVKLSGCVGSVEGGTFGPVVVCIPGPIRERPEPILRGSAHVAIDGAGGVFDGTVQATLFGDVTADANNICL